MKENEDFELNLNHLTVAEHSMEENFDEYKGRVALWMVHKELHLFAEDILIKYPEGVTLEEIFNENPDQYVPGMGKEKNGRGEQVWYDILERYIIEPSDIFFDYFFICKMRHVDLLDIDNYLAYQLEKSFDNDLAKFHRFILLIVRKHKKLLTQEQSETVNEWVNTTKSEQATVGEQRLKTFLSNTKRTIDDKKTVLNLQQTVLLVRLLQEGRMLLDDTHFNKTQAGQALNILSGYSADSLRMELGNTKTKADKKDLEKLHASITKLLSLINRKIEGKQAS
jgi:hypothetical protein